MDCKKFEKLAVESMDEKIRPEENRKLQEHMDGCPRCSRILAEYSEIAEAAKKIETPSYSPEFWDEKLREIKAPAFQRPRLLLRPAAAAVAATALLFFSLVLFRGTPGREEKPSVSNNAIHINLFSELPYSEEYLMDMIEYIDDESASEILDIIYSNNSLSAHLR